jgi:pimeloyl-ACP methyl ester carboxylesterase
MAVRIETIPTGAADLPALIVDPGRDGPEVPVLLYLHGKGEAGATPNTLPIVCAHQSPPFQAILGRLADVLVVAPQAPPHPNVDKWNWRDHVGALVEFLSARFAGRSLLAAGFSRGGLGVLQLVAAAPDLFGRWATVDPQAGERAEIAAILASPSLAGRGWLRYGFYRERKRATRKFAAAFASRFPPHLTADVPLGHPELALGAFSGEVLSSVPGASDLYTFLGLRYQRG